MIFLEYVGSRACLSATKGVNQIIVWFTSFFYRGCLKIELRWPLLFYFKLKSFGFFSKKEAYKLTFSIQTVFYWYKPPKRLFLQDYVQWPAGRTQFQPS